MFNKSVLLSVLLLTNLAGVGGACATEPWENENCKHLRPFGPNHTKPNNDYGAECHLYSPATAAAKTAMHQIVIFCDKSMVGCPIYSMPLNSLISSVGYTGVQRPPCDQLAIAYICPEECYTPNQQLLFNNAYQSIERAYTVSSPTVTALTGSATLMSLDTGEQPIEEFSTKGFEGDVYTLVTDQGHRVEVTGNHPLISPSGSVVHASSLSVGDSLLMSSGEITSLVDVTTRPYSGPVWNVSPLSNNKKENILVNNGLLTGSLKFQNQFKEDEGRLLRADAFDVSGI